MTPRRAAFWFPTILALTGLILFVHASAVAQRKEDVAAQQKRARPQAQPLRVEKLSPELERILQDWATASAGIKKLEGKHFRHVYDKVFSVEKQAQGDFYYESPDKGRIDITEVRIPPREVSKKKDKKGNPYQLKSDQPVRWICDGKSVMQLDPLQRSGEKFNIPPQAQGQNIMDGPLPFLFGMPPQQAKKRYRIRLVKETETTAHLVIFPRWPQDAANYKRAEIILTKDKFYLPYAVKLIDPSGNRETVYRFEKLKVNPRGPFIPLLGKDPFHPRLRGWKIIEAKAGKDEILQTKAERADRNPGNLKRGKLDPRNLRPAPDRTKIPSVVNMLWTDAGKLLEQAGYTVKYIPGKVAANKKLVYVVYAQNPPANSPREGVKKIQLTLYNKPQAGKPPRKP